MDAYTCIPRRPRPHKSDNAHILGALGPHTNLESVVISYRGWIWAKAPGVTCACTHIPSFSPLTSCCWLWMYVSSKGLLVFRCSLNAHICPTRGARRPMQSDPVDSIHNIRYLQEEDHTPPPPNKNLKNDTQIFHVSLIGVFGWIIHVNVYPVCITCQEICCA